MDQAAYQKPSILLRIAQFPLVRLIILGGIIFVLMGVTNGFRARVADDLLKSLGVVIGMAGLAALIYVGFVRFVERRKVSELSLSGMGKELGVGVLVGSGLYTTCVLILMLLGIYRIEGFNPALFMLTALPMAISSSIFEELLFRGVLFRITEEALGSWLALAISSLLFGFMHLLNPQGTLQGAIFITIEAGVLLAAAYMVTRRLWMSIGFHFSWNYTQEGIFSGIVSGGESDPGLIKPVIEGPEWLTGGSFGLESSFIAFLLCTTTGVVLLLLAIRRGNLVPLLGRNRSD
ncbi:CPBP family intramembrane metalloprotease [Sphingorhabdus pulchriflava]|uniref:CPBP family intramembrane metalloprotease n=1 Tax=Sphingorhabdus pulchriflava TaxID=2292257 RepID=A0A371B4K5_9SPHN|nr:type II CAAX endopeptidase family protein [Sphingorhabdus pulchriflava]RDV02447.1 CPBP family intramembrane metalloprotease [Sphingorhabdus pulchriflava]